MTTQRWKTAFIVCFVFMVMQGAARGQALMSSQMEDIRRQAKSIVVVPAAYTPEIVYDIRSSEAPRTGLQKGLIGATFLLGALQGNVTQGLSMLNEKVYNSLPEEQTQKIMAPLIEAMKSKGVTFADVSARFAEQIAAASSGLTESTVKVVKEGGPRTSDKAIDHTVSPINASDMAIVVRIDKILLAGHAKGKEKPAGDTLPEEKTSDGTPFVPVESDPQVAIILTGDVAAVRISDGSDLLKEPFRESVPSRRQSEWTQDPLAMLRDIDAALQSFSRYAMEKVFLLHNIQPITSGGRMVYCMMAARESELGLIRKNMRGEIAEVSVDTLQPTLKWEAFPRYTDREDGPKGLADKISDVTYDLKVWKGTEGRPLQLIYERTGAKTVETWKEHRVRPMRPSDYGGMEEQPEITRREGLAEHKMEATLEPASEYYWTVRARFKLDGKTRISPWSHYYAPNKRPECPGRDLPGAGLNYWFRTPQPGTS